MNTNADRDRRVRIAGCDLGKASASFVTATLEVDGSLTIGESSCNRGRPFGPPLPLALSVKNKGGGVAWTVGKEDKRVYSRPPSRLTSPIVNQCSPRTVPTTA